MFFFKFESLFVSLCFFNTWLFIYLPHSTQNSGSSLSRTRTRIGGTGEEALEDECVIFCTLLLGFMEVAVVAVVPEEEEEEEWSRARLLLEPSETRYQRKRTKSETLAAGKVQDPFMTEAEKKRKGKGKRRTSNFNVKEFDATMRRASLIQNNDDSYPPIGRNLFPSHFLTIAGNNAVWFKRLVVLPIIKSAVKYS